MRHGRYLVVLAGIGVAAAGCGTVTAQTASLTAAVTNTTAQTARVAVTTTMQAQGMSVSFTETGQFDFAHSRGTVSMQSPIGITEIFLPPKVYIKVPGSAGGLPHGKSWIAVDTGNSADSSFAGMGAAEGIGAFFGSSDGDGADPADLLASLTAISGNVTKLGAATVRGVPVTEFRVNVDLAKAATRLPGWERAGVRDFASSLGTSDIPVEVWVDGQNLVRRMQVSLHPPASTGTPAGTTYVQVTDFYDFGVPVRVSAPPAAQVASMSQMTSGSSVSFGGMSSVSSGSSGGFSGSGAGSGGSGAGSSEPNGSLTPPQVSGTLSPAQAAAAEQVVSAFWAALKGNAPASAAQMVVPAQQSCASALLGGPKITVKSFRIASAQPAGDGRATVRFTVQAQASLGGQNFPMFPQDPNGAQWLVAAESAGHWYVDLAASGDVFSGACS
jgi:hypothetical protein